MVPLEVLGDTGVLDSRDVARVVDNPWAGVGNSVVEVGLGASAVPETGIVPESETLETTGGIVLGMITGGTTGTTGGVLPGALTVKMGESVRVLVKTEGRAGGAEAVSQDAVAAKQNALHSDSVTVTVTVLVPVSVSFSARTAHQRTFHAQRLTERVTSQDTGSQREKVIHCIESVS